jgi:hypothetical protein
MCLWPDLIVDTRYVFNENCRAKIDKQKITVFELDF